MVIPENMSFEQLLLDEIGLEFSSNGCLIDQDTRCNLLYMSKPIVKEDMGRHDCYKFDPYRNPKFMSFLFSYFTNKIRMEQNVYVDVIYYKPIKNSRNSPLAVKANGEEYVSRIYTLEALKYLDLICQLNGDLNPDLSQYDIKDT